MPKFLWFYHGDNNQTKIIFILKLNADKIFLCKGYIITFTLTSSLRNDYENE